MPSPRCAPSAACPGSACWKGSAPCTPRSAPTASTAAWDQESRAYYRGQVSRIAERTGRPELSVCAGALSLAQGGGEGVRGHVGYYLLDDGLRQLLRYLQAPRAKSHSPALAAGLLRLSGWAALAALLAAAWALGLPWPVWTLFAVVFFCAAQRAAAVVLLRRLRPRMVPRMQVDQLDASTQTLVVCPTMLMDAAHAISMVKHLSVLHQANPDPHLHFLLLGDFQDSLTGTLSGDGDIVAAASAAVRALCEDTVIRFSTCSASAFSPPTTIFT